MGEIRHWRFLTDVYLLMFKTLELQMRRVYNKLRFLNLYFCSAGFSPQTPPAPPRAQGGRGRDGLRMCS